MELALAAPGCWRNSLGIDLSTAGAAAAAAHLIGAVWLHILDRRCCLKAGASRLAAAAPLVALNLAVPLLFCRSQDAITMLIIV